jgi:hypothetical protein
LQRVRRQWIIDGSERSAADIFVLELKLMAEYFGDGLQDEDGLLSDFGADAVAGENSNFQEHEEVSLTEGLSRCTIICNKTSGLRPDGQQRAAAPT